LEEEKGLEQSSRERVEIKGSNPPSPKALYFPLLFFQFPFPLPKRERARVRGKKRVRKGTVTSKPP